jgi:ABC-2 type transport system permease protein
MAARLLPSTHAMNAFKGLAMGQTADFSPWGGVIVLLSGGVLAFALAYALFRWDSQLSTRRMPAVAGVLALLPYALSILLLK